LDHAREIESRCLLTITRYFDYSEGIHHDRQARQLFRIGRGVQ
jgi:hypothetical protein